MTRLYIAGPMRNYPQFNFPAFFEAEDQLREAGYEVVNPAGLDVALGFDPNDEPSNYTEADYHAAMRRDLAQLFNVDGVALLHGWRKSKGANVEHDVARALGLTAMLVDAWLYQATRQRESRLTR